MRLLLSAAVLLLAPEPTRVAPTGRLAINRPESLMESLNVTRVGSEPL